LVHATLMKNEQAGIPAETREKLRNFSGHIRRRALLQTAELLHLMKIFSAQNIDLLPWKGVFLSHQLYGDTGMRSSSDIDILVRPEQIEQAAKLLLAEGYRNSDWLGYELTPRQRELFKKLLMTHHFGFEHPGKKLHLELHQNFSTSLLLDDIEPLWKSTKREAWQGLSVTCLDDEALLLLLCFHGGIHHWVCLKWLSDVARLLALTKTRDWARLLALADRMDLKRPLAQGALLSHWIYDIDLPSELCNLIKNEKTAAALSAKALTCILKSAVELNVPGEGVSLIWRVKKLRPSTPAGAMLKSSLVFPEDCRTIQLPNSLFWLYYPLRPFLWFWRRYLRN